MRRAHCVGFEAPGLRGLLLCRAFELRSLLVKPHRLQFEHIRLIEGKISFADSSSTWSLNLARRISTRATQTKSIGLRLREKWYR